MTTTATQPSTDASTPGTTVAVREINAGERLGTVEVRIAETFEQRYMGSALPNRSERTKECCSSTTRRASTPTSCVTWRSPSTSSSSTQWYYHDHPPRAAPAGGDLRERPDGYAELGKYVLEVNRGWTNRTGVAVGDRVELPPEATSRRPFAGSAPESIMDFDAGSVDDVFEDARERVDRPMLRLFTGYGQGHWGAFVVGLCSSIVARMLDLLPPIPALAIDAIFYRRPNTASA